MDRYHNIIKKSFEEFGISFDIYSRTTSAIHHQMASDFFRKLYDKGEFIEKTSEQYYDEEAKQFLADRYITGTCPHCGNEGLRDLIEPDRADQPEVGPERERLGLEGDEALVSAARQVGAVLAGVDPRGA